MIKPPIAALLPFPGIAVAQAPMPYRHWQARAALVDRVPYPEKRR